MFKKILALLLATMMVLGGMVTVAAEEAEAPVEEVVDTVDYDAIYAASADKLAALDILKGNGVDYALDDYVQRWHMALFVARIMSGETKDEFWNEVADNTTKFDDVDNYFGAIDYVSERGIVKGKGWIPGVGSNCFAPNESIILQDALTMVVRALGYKQLENYPDDFVAKAEALGLTAGLEELDLTAPLTRGQMVQILTNTLFTEIDGTSFAKANFGLEEQTYVIVATEFQALLGAEKVMRVDYLDGSEKWVALAPINADGTYDLANVVYFTETELDIEGKSEQKLGYSYVVTSFNAFEDVADVTPVEPEYFSNYGSQVEIASGSKYYNLLKDDAIIKINGKTYRLVEAYTELTNKPSYVNKQPEIIVHSMYNGESELESYNYLYDLSGNILDPKGQINADGMLPVAIYYTAWNNTYFVQDAKGGFRYATEDDFLAVAIGSATSAPRFGVVTEAALLTGYKFSEIAMFDDDNDGDFDRGVFMPYSVGQYATASAAKNTTAAKGTLRDKKGTTGSSATTYVTISGEPIHGYFYDANEFHEYQYINANAIEWELNDNPKPAAGDYIVYNYNVYTRVLNVIDNLGKPEAGIVSNFKAAEIKLNDAATGFKVDGKDQVYINDTWYYIGYADADVYTCDADAANAVEGFTTYGFTAIDDEVNGAAGARLYLKDIYDAWSSKTQLAQFIALDNTIIYFAPVEPATEYADWVIFDYGTSDVVKNQNQLYTTYTYNGDILGVTEEGLIEINAYDPASGTNSKAYTLVDKINGQRFGYLVEDYAIMQYQFSGVGFVADPNALETMKKIVIKDFFRTLTADFEGTETERQFMFKVEPSEEFENAYDLTTDLSIYWNKNFTTKQPKEVIGADDVSGLAKVMNEITFRDGISSIVFKAGVDKDGKAKQDTTRLFMNANSTIVIADKDSIETYKGIPDDTAKLTNLDGAYVYSINNDLIVIVDPDGDAERIYQGYKGVNLKGDGWTYYMVTAATTVSVDTIVNPKYTYKNLYNINTGTVLSATPEIKGGLDGFNVFNAAETLFNTAYVPFVTNKLIGTIYAVKDGDWTNYKVLTSIEGAEFAKYVGYNQNTKSVLTSILYYGLDAGLATNNFTYTGVYKNYAWLNGKSSHENEIMIPDGDKNSTYDRDIKFAFDIVKFTEANGKVTKIEVTTTDVKSNADAANVKGNIFYNYVGNDFQGLVVVNGAAPVNPNPEIPATEAEKALAELKAIAGSYVNDPAIVALLNTAKTALEAQGADIEAVKVAQAQIIAAKVEDLIVADSNIAAAKKSAEDALKDLKANADYILYKDEACACGSEYTPAKHVVDIDKQFGEAETVAEYNAVLLNVNFVSAQVAEIKAAKKAEADAEAAKVEIVKIENDTIYFKNLNNIQAIEIYTAAADTSLTVARFVKVNLAWTADADNATAGIKVGDSFKTNAMTDGNFKVAMVAEATADNWATGTISFEYTAPTGGTPAPIFVKGTTYRVVITNGTEPVTYIGIAG